MKPKVFWRLTIDELFWLLDAWRPVRMYGDMPESEVAAIYDEDYGSEED